MAAVTDTADPSSGLRSGESDSRNEDLFLMIENNDSSNSSSSSSGGGAFASAGGSGSSSSGGGHHHPNNNLMTTSSYLQSRLSQLKSQSNNLSNELTKRLATSRSGQSLLNIGPSLSTLPPDLSSLLEAITPLLRDVEMYEKENLAELNRLVNQGREVQMAVRKRTFALECAEIYRELIIAEDIVQWDMKQRQQSTNVGNALALTSSEKIMKTQNNHDQQQKKKIDEEEEKDDSISDNEEDDDEANELDHASSLERVTYTVLHLLKEIHSSTVDVSSIAIVGSIGGSGNSIMNAENASSDYLPSLNIDDNKYNLNTSGSGVNSAIIEKSNYLLKLSPRIRRLESDVVKCLVRRFEDALIMMRSLKDDDGDKINKDDEVSFDTDKQRRQSRRRHILLLTMGHFLRGLALLQKGHEAESTFARVAIMPIVRSKLSIGKLDEGGLRGECAGLFFVLDDIANTVKEDYGDILRFSECMFAFSGHHNHRVGDNRRGDGDPGVGRNEFLETIGQSSRTIEIDLVVCGVWIPVATALMTDTSIKMAIFSPGIANVLQANYSAIDTFLSELACTLLTPPIMPSFHSSSIREGDVCVGESQLNFAQLGNFEHLYYEPKLDHISIQQAQARLHSHPTTTEFYKRWNLPIYYQIRFAEFTKRLDQAIMRVQNEGWQADVFSSNEVSSKEIHETLGFELPIFLELYDILLSMWKSTVFLRPLTHRFLRGSAQLIGRVLAFVKEGLEGKIKFGGEFIDKEEVVEKGKLDEAHVEEKGESVVKLPSYYWNERVEDVAMVSWELTILDTVLSHDYAGTIAKTVCPSGDPTTEFNEIKLLASEILRESSQVIAPLVTHSWNVVIINNLTALCCTPISAVKGVAATYRMTNRPPPTQASPYVATILRPLQEFDRAFASRTPPQIGEDWKRTIISSVSDKYSIAVEELIATVKRTEEALKSRTTKRMLAGGMSDGEKVKLQLFLDNVEFNKQVDQLIDVNLGPVSKGDIIGLVKLEQLTKEGGEFLSREG